MNYHRKTDAKRAGKIPEQIALVKLKNLYHFKGAFFVPRGSRFKLVLPDWRARSFLKLL
jgi:hypothetical protein